MAKVSIIIPSYNRGHFILKTLESVFEQTSNSWECFIVDDGSTDDTEEKVKHFIDHHPGYPFYWLKNTSTKGAQGARNTGIMHSTGEYLIFLDSDDILTPHCIANRLEAAKTNPGIGVYAFPVRLFNEKPGDSQLIWNKLLKPNWDILDRFLVHDAPWQTLGCFWSRDAILKIGMWDERVTSLQDWDVHIQAVMHPEIEVWLCNDELAFDAYYRVGGYDSVSKKFSTPQGAQTNAYLVEKTHKAMIYNNLMHSHLPAFKRFLWIMNTLISIGDNDLGNQVYKDYKYILDLGIADSKLYDFYYEARFNQKYPKILRGIASLIPKISLIKETFDREDTCMKLTIDDLTIKQ